MPESDRLCLQVCGDGEGIEGDCVVPLGSALLPGARHVILDGVYHSMSRIGTFDEESGECGPRRWAWGLARAGWGRGNGPGGAGVCAMCVWHGPQA